MFQVSYVLKIRQKRYCKSLHIFYNKSTNISMFLLLKIKYNDKDLLYKKNIYLYKSPENKTKQKSNHFMLFILFCKRKYSVRSVIIFHLKLLIQKRLLLVWQPVELLLSINIKVFINSLIYILVDHMRHIYRLHF